MHETQLKDGASNNNNKAASIGTNVDSTSTNMNNMNITNSKDDVSKYTECGKKQAEIKSNKKVSTSCAKKVGTSDDDSGEDLSGLHHLRQLSLTSSSKIDKSSAKNVDKMDISDEILFQNPPPKKDCQICLLPMPHSVGVCGIGISYMQCCGKMLCCGCLLASQNKMKKGAMKSLCLYCRVPLTSSAKELLKRYKKRMKLNDSEAFHQVGSEYRDGDMQTLGLPQNYEKAVELWKQAAALGSIMAHCSLGRAYYSGRGVESDVNKAVYHMAVAAIGGHELARYDLGVIEENKGNMNRAMKHYVIAARCGVDKSLKLVGEGYKAGYVTKDEYASTLRAYQHSCDEMKSEQREEAAKVQDWYRQSLLPST